ncbi:MAG: hypothetical protein NC206_00350 [Bacteroides sp.]|nr:hypothetical protein [Roseburia sp.]MCM1345525.1 hypothetical protein [Bacteroides sp.]MCM1420356.1 hypothetical protein [Bacteroides sp.]
MNFNQQTATIVREAIRQAANKYAETEECNNIVTDFHIYIREKECKIEICDDEDTLLAAADFQPLFAEMPEKARLADMQINKLLQHELHDMNKGKEFDNVNIFKPFSFLLENPDDETFEELLIVDDNNVIVCEELLKGLDEFLHHLLDE